MVPRSTTPRRSLLLACAWVLLVGAPAALAQTAGGPAQAAAPANDDFDLLAPAPAVDAAAQARAEELTRTLELRRTLLRTHQLAGFVNLAGVGTAVVLGQLNYADKYGGGGDTGKYSFAHGVAAWSSLGIFAVTGALALFAPSPLEKQARLDTATLHKTAMVVATAGMAAQILLGLYAGAREGQLSQRDLALAHQITGYVTLGATLTGFAVLTF